MAHRSIPLLAVALLAGAGLVPSSHAEALRVGGTGAAIGTMRLLAAEFEKVSPGDSLLVVPNLGTNGGIKALGAGALEIAVAARSLKPEEAAQGLVAMEYGRTPFGVAISKSGTGPVGSIADIVALYGGRRATWPSGTPVRVVLRPLKDNDTEMLGAMSAEMKALLPEAIAKPGMIIAATDQDAADAIERTPGAIGTSTLALVTTEKRHMQFVSINGAAPTVRALVDGSYPYAKSMYVVRKAAMSPGTARFVEFLSTPKARQVIADAGHAPPAARDPR